MDGCSCYAIYHCDNTYDKLTFGKGTKLVVKPETQQEKSSVYKLKSSTQDANLPNSVCLFTDFSNPNQNVTINENVENLKDKAVLDKSTNDVWRYSAVIWDHNDSDVTCNGTDNSKSDTDNTEKTCSSLDSDKNFQTNPSLNIISLKVLGLRILTGKAIVFNLIITARLWSY